MNGAHALMSTLTANGVDVCFANPGTSEMHFVAALDDTEGMRCVLGLFEGTVTGAADGYARMTGRPAVTLLHLGPGMANGLSNLHNALRAQSPIVNVIGDHATYHRHLDAPLTSDIEGAARPFSHWVRTTPDADSVAADTAAAVRESLRRPGRIASLILPADAAWNELAGPVSIPDAGMPDAAPADELAVDAAARLLAQATSPALVLGPGATLDEPLRAAGKIAAATGCALLTPTMTARITRGAGRVPVRRIPYVVEDAQKFLSGFDLLVMVGAKAPVSFFAYPERPSLLYPRDAQIIDLARADQDLGGALEALVDALGAAGQEAAVAPAATPATPTGELTIAKLGALIGAALPENAIVVDESITSGRTLVAETEGAAPHDWLVGTGGSIGYAMPCAVGAAVACPDRKVVVLESDGSAMYQPQALWTAAREQLDMVVLIFANRRYNILHGEMRNVGVPEFGAKARALLDIDNPAIDFVSLAASLGVPATAVSTADELAAALGRAMAERGPALIEVRL
ncbi:acetolactate synthase large subunit [Cumulibacter manganitolerans]|uniref:acetolactate synthase large subunit n=1 Tax=Cumulibacter manganitolerans TaxID=1884992 RepID=UPI001295BC80|nr:acetolactate synthase large subunit [Cumulibacter manganitolerans]